MWLGEKRDAAGATNGALGEELEWGMTFVEVFKMMLIWNAVARHRFRCAGLPAL